MSNTGQTAMEALRGGKIKRPEGVVHVARVYARIGGGDDVRFAPECLAVKEPGLLVPGQVLDLGPTSTHS